jgi:hypothetical protein
MNTDSMTSETLQGFANSWSLHGSGLRLGCFTTANNGDRNEELKQHNLGLRFGSNQMARRSSELKLSQDEWERRLAEKRSETAIPGYWGSRVTAHSGRKSCRQVDSGRKRKRAWTSGDLNTSKKQAQAC